MQTSATSPMGGGRRRSSSEGSGISPRISTRTSPATSPVGGTGRKIRTEFNTSDGRLVTRGKAFPSPTSRHVKTLESPRRIASQGSPRLHMSAWRNQEQRRKDVLTTAGLKEAATAEDRGATNNTGHKTAPSRRYSSQTSKNFLLPPSDQIMAGSSLLHATRSPPTNKHNDTKKYEYYRRDEERIGDLLAQEQQAQEAAVASSPKRRESGLRF